MPTQKSVSALLSVSLFKHAMSIIYESHDHKISCTASEPKGKKKAELAAMLVPQNFQTAKNYFCKPAQKILLVGEVCCVSCNSVVCMYVCVYIYIYIMLV